MPAQRPPPGILSLKDWRRWCREPTLADIVSRHAAVLAAVLRYREAGIPPPPVWLVELGVIDKRPG